MCKRCLLAFRRTPGGHDQPEILHHGEWVSLHATKRRPLNRRAAADPPSAKHSHMQQKESQRVGHRPGLEADLQDLAVIAYEPTRMRIRESDGPVAARPGYWNPRETLIGSKSSFS